MHQVISEKTMTIERLQESNTDVNINFINENKDLKVDGAHSKKDNPEV